MKKLHTAHWRKSLSVPLRQLKTVSEPNLLMAMTEKLFRSTAVKALLIVLLAAMAVSVTKPAVETVFATYQSKDGRKLPIYSVDIPEKKVAISFDAAWGA